VLGKDLTQASNFASWSPYYRRLKSLFDVERRATPTIKKLVKEEKIDLDTAARIANVEDKTKATGADVLSWLNLNGDDLVGNVNSRLTRKLQQIFKIEKSAIPKLKKLVMRKAFILSFILPTLRATILN